MDVKASQYQRSDAWLLLSIIYASPVNGASLRDIISAGDYINHAIFTFDELSGGLQRLIAGGLIREQNGAFAATDIIIKAYRRTTTPRRTALKELADASEFLKMQDKPLPDESGDDRRFVDLTRDPYNNALKDYQDG